LAPQPDDIGIENFRQFSGAKGTVAIGHRRRSHSKWGWTDRTLGCRIWGTKAIKRSHPRITSKGGVRVALLFDDSTAFKEDFLESVPHVTLRMKDDLLERMVDLQKENAELRSLSLIDNLTGLGNKRFFWLQLETEMARTRRTGHSCVLMMVDLDNFKSLNDNFGHLEGDRFLEEFGRIIRDNIRSTDLPCRYGGDEFVLVMPTTSVPDAIKTGRRLMDKVAKTLQKSSPPISLSIGVAEYTPFSRGDANDFVRRTDTALYEAKGAGKNQVRVDSQWMNVTLEEEEVNHDERDALYANYL
jgi:two-component system, cell cycle response regulator